MNITLKNLGPIREADFTVGDFTIICGRNNTGKTYVTYALYGYLDYFHHGHDAIKFEALNDAANNRHPDSPIYTSQVSTKDTIKKSAKQYSNRINTTFAGQKSVFSDSEILIDIPSGVKRIGTYTSREYETTTGDHLSVEIEKDSSDESISILLHANERSDLLDWVAFGAAIVEGIRNGLYQGVIPKPFIVSAERTGAALFQREVDFTRSKLIDLLKETNVNPRDLLGRFTADYPVPVKHNIDFVRDLPNIVKKESTFAKQHPEVLQAFSDILGGHYIVNQTGSVEYTPTNNPEISLSLAESSSTVRSLVNIGFYLRHIAQPGDLLMVDEPELNLHPQNQRKVARLFAMLVNHGIRVFITTHSDYMIRELNTLLLLNKPDDERLKEVMEREGYAREELLVPEQLKIYMTTEDKNTQGAYTLIPAKITEESGIELTTFDDTIDDMNRIQDEIVWG